MTPPSSPSSLLYTSIHHHHHPYIGDGCTRSFGKSVGFRSSSFCFLYRTNLGPFCFLGDCWKRNFSITSQGKRGSHTAKQQQQKAIHHSSSLLPSLSLNTHFPSSLYTYLSGAIGCFKCQCRWTHHSGCYGWIKTLEKLSLTWDISRYPWLCFCYFYCSSSWSRCIDSSSYLD